MMRPVRFTNPNGMDFLIHGSIWIEDIDQHGSLTRTDGSIPTSTFPLLTYLNPTPRLVTLANRNRH